MRNPIYVRATVSWRKAWLCPLVLACLCAGAMAEAPKAPEAPEAPRAPAMNPDKATSLAGLSVTRAGARLVSAGARGVILLSDDNGRTWRQAKVPVSAALTRVRFADSRNGWAVGHGGVVLATRDAGETWQKQLDGAAAAQLELAAARREDGDESRRLAEARRLVQDGSDKPFLDVHFTDAQHGMVVGAYGLAFRTDDGGKTWQSMMGKVAAGDGRHLYAIAPSKGALYLFGEQGTVLGSVDGGKTFARMAFPGKGTIFGALSSPTGDVLLAYGLKGNVYRSGDAGKRWERVELPNVSMVSAIRLDAQSILLVDESGLTYRSNDDGRHFTAAARVQPATDLIQVSDGAVLGSGLRGTFRIAGRNEAQGANP
ncbi:WD40/YVTN/BNR-like repeat-containing protein [Cupriavidus sp. NPDC089707]|uniref:WD40/YVTN/BNR-like repeat-containing protein n=1 Tax=Cupriavidus sp. NPDC089707 TaxID=3363963 RepID=UPI0037F45F19